MKKMIFIDENRQFIERLKKKNKQDYYIYLVKEKF